jgi:hypothetical protein
VRRFVAAQPSANVPAKETRFLQETGLLDLVTKQRERWRRKRELQSTTRTGAAPVLFGLNLRHVQLQTPWEVPMRSLCSLLLLGTTALLAGCGPSARDLRERTISTLNTTADTWDGGPDFKTDATDAYGNPIVATVSKGLLNYTLELRSHGPDALPKNSDDISVSRQKRHGETTVNEEVERGSESVGRGGARGFVQGIKQGLKGDPAGKKKQ